MIQLIASFGSETTVFWSATDLETAEDDRVNAIAHGATAVRFELQWDSGALVEVGAREVGGAP